MKKETAECEWQNIKVKITHSPNKFGKISHLELKADEQLPVTETGYRSMYYESGLIEEYENIEAFVKALLDEAMQSKEWQDYVKKKQKKSQLSLF